jgi:hypothetical protein
MSRTFLIALLLTVGQATADEQVISIQHDSSRLVTCWITPQGGISCLPDSSLPQTHTGTTSNESETARASLANSTGQSEQFPTTPPPQDERFRL